MDIQLKKHHYVLFICFVIILFMSPYPGIETHQVLATTDNIINNPSFEEDEETTLTPDGWNTITEAGDVTTQSEGHSGEYSVKLESSERAGDFSNPSVGIYQFHTGLEQGTYTVSLKVRTSNPDPDSGSQQEAAYLEAKDTGAPEMRAFINLFADDSSDWNHVVLRNVIVYNGQATIGVYLKDAVEGTTLEVDDVEFNLEHSDNNPLVNWDFESGNTDGWSVTGDADVVDENVDAGEYATELKSESRISQTVEVKPNTEYIATVRAKVSSESDRINIGVEGINETRSAPSTTTNYSLLPVAFSTGSDETTATIYLERTNGGSGNGYVDSIDLFELDQTVTKGVDVSYLPIVEDFGGKYKANGVEQDFFDIIRNRGVNAVTSMFFVEAGNYIYDETEFTDEDWEDFRSGVMDGLPRVMDTITYTRDLEHLGTETNPRTMIPGYFGKEQAIEIGKRAKEQGMKFEISFHYSDQWMSAGKAWKPLAWFDQDLQQLQTTMYNYSYDFVKTMVDEGVTPDTVKMGNEQNAGLVWPEGRIWSDYKEGFAKLVNASYQGIKDASPTTRGFLHLNNGYDVDYTNNWYADVEEHNIEWDGEAYSLYGGRETGSIVSMLKNNLNRWKDKDVIFSETGLAHTRNQYSPMNVSGNISNKFYEISQRGQYNWLIEYMQAFRDVPNPHNAEIGFFYWAAEWLSKGEGHDEWFSPWIPGGSNNEYGNTVENRTLFTYDGHVSDGMLAYLWRGKASSKEESGKVSHNSADAYSVEPTSVTGVELDEADLELVTGESQRLVPTIKPVEQFTYSNVSWSSSDESIATVDKHGIVTGVNPGISTITVKTEDGGFTASRNVKVDEQVLASDLTIKSPEVSDQLITATVGEHINIDAEIGNDASDNRLIFTSSDPEVASFLGEAVEAVTSGHLIQQPLVTDDVTLIANREGSTEITISSADGNVQESFMLEITKIAVDNVEIQSSITTIGINRTAQLEATVFPEDASYPDLEWTINDESIATVNNNGQITGVTEGEATITATSVENSEASDSVTISVVPIKAETIEIDQEMIGLRKGDTQTINATVFPEDTTNKALEWSSSDTNVFTVNEGEVLAVGNGEAELTITSEDGGVTTIVNVLVADDLSVTGVEIDLTELELIAGQYQQLQASVIPSVADNTNVEWSSSDETIAKVTNDGFVIAENAGEATITVETVDGGYKAETTVLVTDELQIGRGEFTDASSLNANHPPSRAVDDVDEDTAWSPGTPSGTNSWWIDLGQTAEINQIDMEFWALQKYIIEVSDDGSTYEEVFDQTDSFSDSESVSNTLPEDVTGRYIKVTIVEATQENQTNWQSIVDFVVKGKFITQPTELVLSESNKSVVMTESFDITAELTPSFIIEEIRWETSDSSLAEVEGSGKEVSINTYAHDGSQGEIKQAIITATSESGLSAELTVDIKSPIIAEDMSIERIDGNPIPSNGKITMVEGETIEFEVSVFQSTADYKPIYWISGDEEIATIEKTEDNSFIVSTHQAGTTHISAIVDSYSDLTGGFLFETQLELTIEPEEEVNKTELENAIQTAETLLDEAEIGEVPGQFPKTAVEALKGAIQEAQLILDKNDLKQVEINQARATLEESVSDFKNTVNKSPEVDKTELETIIKSAQADLDESEIGDSTGQYPQTAVDALEQVIQESQMILDNSEITQDEVDVAIGELKSAIDVFLQSMNEDPNDEQKTIEIGIEEKISVEAGSIITIEGSRSKITLPNDLPTGTTLIVKEVDLTYEGLNRAGDLFDFEFDYPIGNEPNGEFTLVLEYDSSNYSADEINIYYLNEKTGEWEHRGGEAEKGTIRLQVPHFSIYGVFAEETDDANNEENPPVDNQDETNEEDQQVENQDQTNEEDPQVDNNQETNQKNNQENEKDKLPDTATNLFNWILLGAILIIIGVSVIYIKKRMQS
ncbi:glycosyl hydrolase 53 family protein [Gracilibacillus massiliensis]|uniref:glycosyl hydrolase 53 family protein n=1 Tax=Gracilibacillus massiliensis TaxID=1564956 RepID=UPI00071C940B|nr:glycosyl hydrolase 53 family protein [Gracilibacillus massiliensis]